MLSEMVYRLGLCGWILGSRSRLKSQADTDPLHFRSSRTIWAKDFYRTRETRRDAARLILSELHHDPLSASLRPLEFKRKELYHWGDYLGALFLLLFQGLQGVLQT
jgi:hypothetical protein